MKLLKKKNVVIDLSGTNLISMCLVGLLPDPCEKAFKKKP